MSLRDAGLNFPILISVREDGDALTIATPTILPTMIGSVCRATIKVRKPDNQDERVVALLARWGGRSPTCRASGATISPSALEGCLVR
jgi:hypothetical protein